MILVFAMYLKIDSGVFIWLLNRGSLAVFLLLLFLIKMQRYSG